MVVLLHVSSTVFSSSDPGIWHAVNFYESFTRSCVPLFFMVTGSLLARSSFDLKSISKRISRVIVPLVFWSIIYLIFFHFHDGSEISLLSLFYKPAAGHLWYLYTLIGVYITMPIICFIYQKGDNKLRITLAAIWFSGCILIPTLRSIGINISSFFDITSIGLYQGYFFAGAMATEIHKNTKGRCLSLIVFIIMSILILELTKSMFDNDGLHDVRHYLNSSVFVALASIGLFFFLHGLPIKNKLISLFIYNQARHTLGIYLIHFSFIYFISNSIFQVSSTNAYYFMPFISIIIYTISFSISLILEKLKMNRLIM